MRRLATWSLVSVGLVACSSFKDDGGATAVDAAADGADGSGPGAGMEAGHAQGEAGAGGGDAGADGPAGAGTDGGGDASAAYATKCSSLGTAACSCNAPDPAAPGNGYACNESVAADALCCADSSWPATGSTCSCMTASCTSEPGGGCDCSLGTAGQVCSDGIVCCVGPSHDCLCTYGVSTCWTGYRQVSQCDALAIGCGPGASRVTSCNVAN